jgi:BirA family biotin operon repressor/biotin-[acetyl-CoA-carboxylase] ligase
LSSTFSVGTPFIELQQVKSTNNYAIGLVHAGMAQHGAAVFAHHQTKGKGQRYKQWQSEANKNIALSIIIRPQGFTLSQSFLISMATAVAVYRFFNNYAGEETKIKWPNDIYWRDRKAAGILIENSIQGTEWKWCVVGIGINMNQTSFDDIATKATSLKQITGKEFEPVLLAKELCNFLGEAYTELALSESSILTAYKNNLFKLNEAVAFKKGPRIFTALVKDVTKNGQLVVQGTIEESFEVGEIEWLI